MSFADTDHQPEAEPTPEDQPRSQAAAEEPSGNDTPPSQGDQPSDAASPEKPGRGDHGSDGQRGGGARPRRRGGESKEFPEQIGPYYHIAFRGGRREVFVNPKKLDLRLQTPVLVEAERGKDLGWVAVCDGEPLKRRKGQPLRGILRVATEEEVSRLAVLSEEDQEALEICRGRAENFNLEMKIIDAETQFDGNRVTFYFTAERRVDFRELVRDLASIFRTRIELRQVGARDAARRCDGMGPCGRQLCCTTHLLEFEPVTLKMAKEQNLSLNPVKISGSCGRLMCCLTYECAAYQAAVQSAPPIGSRWRLRKQEVEVTGHDIGNNRVIIGNAENETTAIDLDDFEARARPAGKRPPESGDHD